MNALVRLAPLALMSVVSACAPKAAGPLPAETAASTPWFTYVCEDGRTVRARYGARDTAQLEMDGRRWLMVVARSASGARYVGGGWQWWSKGREAMLAPLKPGEDIADPGQRCAPPAPAAVSEASPPEPKSGQAAAQALETYFRLLEGGQTEAAARLRSDGSAGDLEPGARLKAQIGAPGRVEGAAGSLYVEIPLSIQARDAAGEPHVKRGKAVMRRVNDVPGATPEQLSWRIERFEFEAPSAAPPTR